MSIYQHFRQEEHGFIDQIQDWKQLVLDEYRPKLTDFLDPREQKIVESVIGKDAGLLVYFSGGQEGAERKRAIIAPDYFEPEPGDFELTLFELQYPVKFATLEHPKILGSLTGMGIRREKFGDILSLDERFQVVVCHEIADYMSLNLDKVGKTKVRAEEKAFVGYSAKRTETRLETRNGLIHET
nr:YlmH/Sll1252 family protein [Salisediminibacterium selenitireducens]